MSPYASIIKALLISYFYLASAKAFQVYWNVPTQQCKRNYGINFVPLLRSFGILVNDDDRFQGENIIIFYESQLGLYPKILKSGKFENGGIPQNGNLLKHLEKSEQDIQEIIPRKDFSGLGVIDWEAWRPTWEFNWDSLRIYQQKSKEFAKERNPTLSDKLILELAENQWGNSSRSYMIETLRLAKKLRPSARWCYYLFPDCYNYKGEKREDFQCSENIKKGNDKLFWLWEESTAICPSIYLYDSHLNTYSLRQRSWKDDGKLKEAVRLASPKAKIFPYVNYYLEEKMVPKDEFWRMMSQIASVGADGAVVWGSSSSVSTERLCCNLKDYILEILGPAVEMVAWKSNFCSREVCSNHGRCTWPKDDSVTAWKLFENSNVESVYAGEITCRCFDGFSGRFCNKR